jgi:hypothetical protein
VEPEVQVGLKACFFSMELSRPFVLMHIVGRSRLDSTPTEEEMRRSERRQVLVVFAAVLLVSLIPMTFSCNGGGDGSGPAGGGEVHGEWSVALRGSLLEIAYGSEDDYPQYAVLHLESGYFRMNYGPGSSWGTSVVLLPSFWEDGVYYQGAPVVATWETAGPNLLLTISGTISGLDVEGEVRLAPPDQDSIVATVAVEVEGDVVLDDRPGEAFKPVMFSSMHISADTWDTQSAFVESEFFAIPESGWIIDPPATGAVFGLIGGTSSWKVSAPTLEVALDRAIDITGWVTGSKDPNDDNVGFWGASDEVIRSWHYEILAGP